jgi:hypothetical protein
MAVDSDWVAKQKENDLMMLLGFESNLAVAMWALEMGRKKVG